jgi:N-acyl-D-aspartate/D-glutamate deacylase
VSNADIIIKNGIIIDGTGESYFKSDIAIKDGSIKKLGEHINTYKNVERVLDAGGLIVCPGFIDMHNHSEITILVDPNSESMIRQGITTMVYGNCGYSPAPISGISRDINVWVNDLYDLDRFQIRRKSLHPDWNTFKDYFEKVEKTGISTNVMSYCGHGMVRAAVMGHEDRAPKLGEIEEMKALVAEAMEDGAVGLSTGLSYVPGCYAKTNEIVELCKVASKYGGIYATHARAGYLDGVKEAIQIGENSESPVHISHVETHIGSWGLQDEGLKLIDEARDRGLDVTCDVVVYAYAPTKLASLIMPDWALDGDVEEILQKLGDPTTRERIREEMIIKPGLRNWDQITICSCDNNPRFVNMNIEEMATEWGKEPWEATFDLLEQDGDGCLDIVVAVKAHDESELKKTLKYKHSMPETDGWAVAKYGDLSESHIHPRAYGSFPLVFRKYVKGETRKDLPLEIGSKLLSIEKAVQKCSYLPAKRMGLRDRGLISIGMKADIVIFDKEKITDKATFSEPHQYPEGIHFVIVNGKIVIEKGEHTGVLPGQILRGPGFTY